MQPFALRVCPAEAQHFKDMDRDGQPRVAPTKTHPLDASFVV